jgi:hypothetical protein
LLVVLGEFGSLDGESVEIEGVSCPGKKSADKKEPLEKN